MEQESKLLPSIDIKMEDVNFLAFGIADLGVFSKSEIKALKKMGMTTVANLQAFSFKIHDIIDDIVKAKNTFLANIVKEENQRFLALKMIDLKKLFKIKEEAKGE